MATINESYPIALQLSEREKTLYPRVHIYISSQEINQSPVALNHFKSGAYYNEFTPSNQAYYLLQTNVYTDASWSTLSSDYGSVMETIQVTPAPTTGAGGASAYISSQLEYISSQVTYISGGLEMYGGGGGKSYAIYTRGKSPWTHQQRDDVISGMRISLKKIDELTRDSNKYHKDEMQEIASSTDTILVRIDNLLSSLSTVRKNINKKASSKETKEILKQVNDAILKLNDYKQEVNDLSSSEEINKINSNIYMLMDMLVKTMSDEELEEEYERFSINRVQKKNRKN